MLGVKSFDKANFITFTVDAISRASRDILLSEHETMTQKCLNNYSKMVLLNMI